MNTVAEIRELLEGYEDPYFNESYGWSGWLWELEGWHNISDDLKARRVHSKGGVEGQGESVRLVIEVANRYFDTSPRYFEKLGSYYSHAGTSWDDYYGDSFSEVFPKEKLVTVYEKV